MKEIQTPWLTSQGVIARDIILKRVQRDLPQVLGEKSKSRNLDAYFFIFFHPISVTQAPLLPLIISVFLMYIDSLDDIFMIVELFLCDIHCPIARSKNQLSADDSTLRDLALLKIKSDKIRLA